MPRLFNKGKRVIQYAHETNDLGAVAQSSSLAPTKTANVSDTQAALLIKLFPNEVVNLDDKANLQSHYESAGAIEAATTGSKEDAAAGAVSAEEYKSGIAKAVAEALEIERARVASDTDDSGDEKGDDEEADDAVDSESLDLIKKLDGMDRISIIALIEQEKLDIDYAKLKNPDALKKAVLNAMEKRQ